MRSSVSVAMCTYNAAPYIIEQLDSLAGQTHLPDELVICDDSSADSTVELIEAWAAGSPFPVRLHVNTGNLGVIKNFERVVSLCESDIIALADQDDVWFPEKLARTAGTLDAQPSVGLAFCDADVVTERLQPLGYSMWETRRFRSAEQRLMASGRAGDVLVRRNVVMGAATVFRSSFRNLVLPIPVNPVHLHDGWIAFLIASVAEILPVPESLMRYRQRGGQEMGAHPPTHLRMLVDAAIVNSWSSTMESNAAAAEWFTDIQARLVACRAEYPCSERTLALVQGKLDHLQSRMAMPRSRPARAVFVARELASRRYHRYSIGLWAAGQDLTA